MQRRTKFFWAVFPLVFLSLQTGCTHSRSYYSRYYHDTPSQILLTPAPPFESAGFYTRWSGSEDEPSKIRYLLDRVANSDLRFIRNGSVYDGKKARQWFLFKKSNYVGKTATAEDFVKRCASFSMKTGKPYLVEFPDGGIYPVSNILKNELSAFENYLARTRQLTQGTAVSPSRPSPVSVALVQAAATATSTSSASN